MVDILIETPTVLPATFPGNASRHFCGVLVIPKLSIPIIKYSIPNLSNSLKKKPFKEFWNTGGIGKRFRHLAA